MGVKLRCMLIAYAMLFFNFCYGQTSSSINGKVVLQDKTAAEAATVVVLNSGDSSAVSSALVNNSGLFSLNVAPGTYILLATRLGYKKYYSGKLTLATGQNLNVNTIELELISNELKGITVISKRPFVEVKPGKTTINPAASITADGKNVLDILRQ